MNRETLRLLCAQFAENPLPVSRCRDVVGVMRNTHKPRVPIRGEVLGSKQVCATSKCYDCGRLGLQVVELFQQAFDTFGHDMLICGQEAHQVARLQHHHPFDDVGHVGAVEGRTSEGEPDLVVLPLGLRIMEVAKRRGPALERFNPTITTSLRSIPSKAGLRSGSRTLRSPIFDLGLASGSDQTAQLAYGPCFSLMRSKVSRSTMDSTWYHRWPRRPAAWRPARSALNLHRRCGLRPAARRGRCLCARPGGRRGTGPPHPACADTHIGDHGRHGHLRGAGTLRDRRGAWEFLRHKCSASDETARCPGASEPDIMCGWAACNSASARRKYSAL